MRLWTLPAVSLLLVTAALLSSPPGARSAPPLRWSDPATWGGRLPRAGDTARIPAGEDVVLDVDPPPLAEIVVAGTLRADDTRDVRLRAGGIAVSGALVFGSDERPFRHRGEIVLSAAGRGEGAIAIDEGGRVDLFAPARRPWTKLARTLAPGATRVPLAQSVDWRPGDRVAIAPSGFEALEAEEATVARVEPGALVLRAPLRYRHFGAVTDGVDERAEIALLSHDLVVRSDAASAARGRGGHVMVMRGGALHATGVQFTQLGQRGRLGRYPIHFHLAGDVRGSYVRGSSVEHSFNRCITIHASRGVELRDDVGFDTIGHCYFLEDGSETGNTLAGDLAILVRAPAAADRLLSSDTRPSGFWISNPDNVVADDVSAGTQGTGFWYDLPERPTGASHDEPLRPRSTPLKLFARDTAHTNEWDGLFVDILRNPPGVTDAPEYVPASATPDGPRPAIADFAGFTSYKNRRHGAWLRAVHVRLTDARIADDAIGVTFAGADAILQESLVVGESENRTGPPKPFEPGASIRGFEFYDGRVGVVATRFAHFVPNAARPAGALSALLYSPFFVDPGNFSRDVRFEDAVAVALPPATLPAPGELGADGYRSTVFRDLDGSVTRALAGAPSGPASIVLDTPFLAGAGCARGAGWQSAVCPGDFGALFVSVLDARPAAAGPVTIERADAGDPATIVLRGNPSANVATGFQTNVRPGGRYRIRFGGTLPNGMKVSLRSLGASARILVDVPQLGIVARPLRGGESLRLAGSASRKPRT